MTITASMVRELRERTSVGMMECKKALTATGGDLEKAIEELRKSGAARAVKKAGRVAAEGVVVLAQDATSAVIVEVNCETDFVARDETFTAFSNAIAATALAQKETNIDAFQALTLAGGESSVEETRQALVAKLGENISLRRIECLEGETLGAYQHGGRIGVLVSLKGGDATLAKDLAMHIAASNPSVINPEDVSKDMIENEKTVFVAQAKESGKPDDIIEKMITGRVKKFLNEISLTGQPFVKDPSTSVAQLLKQANASVERFIRFEVGEGIEKKVDNFVEEVMAQAKGA